MQATGNTLSILVGDEKTPITLTDTAVEAVQGEAAGKAVDAFAGIWKIEQRIEGGEGFDTLDINALLELRDHLQTAREVIDVLIECRPLSELGSDED